MCVLVFNVLRETNYFEVLFGGVSENVLRVAHRGGSRIFERGGSILGLQGGGGPGGSNFGPNVNKPTSWDKRGADPL